MKRTFTVFTAVALMFVIFCSSLPFFTFASDGALFQFVNGCFELEYEVPTVEKTSLLKKSKAAIPKMYDGRAEGVLPPVRNQGEHGACWAFSSIAAAEISLVKKGLAKADSIDLSELQLIYYMYNTPDDPLGNYTGDKSIRADGNILASGNTEYASRVFERWNTLADEEVMPYSDAVFATKHDYPNEFANEFTKYHIKNFYIINMNQTDEVKRCIMEYGSVILSYYSDLNLFASDKKSYYQNKETATNHAVTVVGWDDNYSVSNFDKALRPKNNGAWLVRNSWGEEMLDGGYMWLSYEDVSVMGTASNGKMAYAVDMESADNYDCNYCFDGGVSTGSWAANGMSNTFVAQNDEQLEAVMIEFPRDANVNYTVKIFVNQKKTVNFCTSGSFVAEKSGMTYYAGAYTVELDKPITLKKGDRFSAYVEAQTASGGKPKFGVDMANSDYVLNRPVYEPAESFRYVGSNMYAMNSGSNVCTPRIKAFTKRNVSIERPSGFDAALKDSQVTLSWSAVDGAKAYEIWSGTDGSDYELLDTTSFTTYACKPDTSKGLTVKYKVRASDGKKVGLFSNADAVRLDEAVPVSSISLSDFTVSQGKTIDIPCTFSPLNASDKLVSYKSSDESIAKVTPDGRLVAVSQGTATLNAYSRSKGKTASCQFTVTDHEHVKYISKQAVPATCEKDGSTQEIRCSLCNAVLSESRKISSLGGHRNTDGDKVCDACDEDMTVNCQCNCHKGGFMTFIWRILNIFNKLFGANEYCNCGYRHW